MIKNGKHHLINYSTKSKHLSELVGRKMNNNSSNYSDYLENVNPQYYYDVQASSNENENLSDNLANYSFTKQSKLPVNYYHENYNYSDLLNNNTLYSLTNQTEFNQSNANQQTNFSQTSKRLFHRNSLICSSMKDKHGTLDGDNSKVLIQRPIDKIEELIANKTLFQADLNSSASASIYSNWNSSERNMITNSSSYDEQENYSLYNNSTIANQSQHLIFKRSSLTSFNENNDTSSSKLPKLMPIYENGRFSNPFSSWKERTFFGTLKFLLSPSSLGLPKNKKDLDITLPIVKPIISSIIPEDKLRVSWIGHATVLVQFENVTLLTDPHFSNYSHPFKFAIKRYRQPPITVNELPENLNLVLISHNHYDHLDYETVDQLNRKYAKKITWFVPLGMKSWFTKLNIQNVIELNWWQEHQITDLDNFKVVALPAQHWSRRGIFDENKELWCSYGLIGKKFRYYFAGDTGYSEKLFRTIGQEYGPWSLASIPIGAYEPNNFLKYQHANPKEALFIHNDIKSNLSMGIHWGTFPLSYEHYLDPPKKLLQYQDELNIPKDRFLAFEHGETRLIKLDSTSKRENTNRYAK